MGEQTVNDLLSSVDGRLASMIEGQETLTKRLDTIESGRKDVLDKLTSHDDTLQKSEDWIKEIQANHNKVRLNAGAASGGSFVERDALLGAMDDTLKSWIPRVAMAHGGDPVSLPDGSVGTRSFACATLAQKDPVLYTAVGGWFQARIKSSYCAIRGRGAEAEKWNTRADRLAEALGGIQTKDNLEVTTDADGGYLVPTVTESMLAWLAKDASTIRKSGASIVQMSTMTHELPSLASDFNVQWKAENVTATDSAPADAFGSGNLTAEKQTGLVTVSIELIQDNIVNLMDFVMQHLMNMVGQAEDTAMFQGTTPFSSMDNAITTYVVAKTPAVAAVADLINLMYKTENAVTVDSGVFYAHPWVVRDVIKAGLASGNAAVLGMMLGSGVPSRAVRNLFGAPCYSSANISRTSGAGTESFVYYGPPQYLVVGDRMGTTFDVNPWAGTEFKQGQVLLRLLRRVGFLVWYEKAFATHEDIQAT